MLINRSRNSHVPVNSPALKYILESLRWPAFLLAMSCRCHFLLLQFLLLILPCFAIRGKRKTLFTGRPAFASFLLVISGLELANQYLCELDTKKENTGNIKWQLLPRRVGQNCNFLLLQFPVIASSSDCHSLFCLF